MKQEFIVLPLVGSIDIIYENPSTGHRTFSGSNELLYSLREFTEEVLGKEFWAYNTINGYKQREKDFTFKGGSGYNVLDVDLLGEHQPNGLSSVFISYLTYKSDKSELNLSSLNDNIRNYNKKVTKASGNKIKPFGDYVLQPQSKQLYVPSLFSQRQRKNKKGIKM